MTTHPTTPKQARHACEQLLKADRADKTEKSILPSEVRVIDRLLERGLELEEAYAEIHGKLVQHPPALKVFFDLVRISAIADTRFTLIADTVSRRWRTAHRACG